MLPLKNRLKKDSDFQKVFSKGGFVASDLISVKFLSNGTDDTKVGFVVSKKISKKAVLRNKIRRMLREIVREKINLLVAGFDIVVLAKKGISDVDYETIAGNLEKTFKKSGLIQ